MTNKTSETRETKALNKAEASFSPPQSDLYKYTKFICVDEEDRPMAWGGDQLCYCTSSSWKDMHHPIKVYTKRHAERLITKTQIFRKEEGLDVPSYRIMPVA
jgi:hypothetical protein